MRLWQTRQRRGFSLIELVIVVIIIGIIAAIAIPRVSRGTSGAADSSLSGSLAVMRNAIDLYQTEHLGLLPTLSAFVTQMTQYSDVMGNTSATKTGDFVYGPYLRAIPPLPLGVEKGSTGVTGTAGTPNMGWVYTATTGSIIANTTTEADSSGKLYNTY
jgi:prepilin-type N-terminal cleavage/methylation domain-containing protein